MTIRVQRIKVPNFTSSAFDLADLCARELWRGINYENGHKQVIKDSNGSPTGMSDEQIMSIFATSFYKKVSNPKLHISITDQQVDNFIKIAKIQVIKTKQSNLDLQKGIDVINNDISKIYKSWNLKNTAINYSDIGINLIQRLSDGFSQPSPHRQKVNHTALASRVLFFTIPDLPVYNFSQTISIGMKLNGEAYAVLNEYVKALHNGLERNWHLLSQYKMPYPTNLDFNVWKKARDSGWWQRRIYDLALKFYFGEIMAGKNEFKVTNFVMEMLLTSPQTH